MKSIDRRQFLTAATVFTGLGSVAPLARTQAWAWSNVPASAPATLKEAATARGLLVGSAVAIPPLRKSPAYAELIRTQCSIVVAENAMKFGPLRPAPNRFSFEDADFLVDFAQKNKIAVRGHNFVWHRQLPRWFDTYVTPGNATQVLTEHIERLGGRYAGRMHSWDVCNEVIEIKDGQSDGLRNSPWYKLLGPEYIDIAFQTARRVDPKAMLCYNDYGIESESAEDAAKRKAVLHLLRGMQSRKVPVDALGIQSHLSAGAPHTYGAGLTEFMAEVQSMGLKLLITEMDVNDRALSPSIPERDAAVGELYGSYLRAALTNPSLCAVLTWGLTDKYTWLNGEGSRPDHLPERCLPFDADLEPVPAYDAMVRALQSAPGRG